MSVDQTEELDVDYILVESAPLAVPDSDKAMHSYWDFRPLKAGVWKIEAFSYDDLAYADPVYPYTSRAYYEDNFTLQAT